LNALALFVIVALCGTDILLDLLDFYVLVVDCFQYCVILALNSFVAYLNPLFNTGY